VKKECVHVRKESVREREARLLGSVRDQKCRVGKKSVRRVCEESVCERREIAAAVCAMRCVGCENLHIMP